MNTRNRTSSEHIGYDLYFYFSEKGYADMPIKKKE
jgi:hypothetical protein